MRFISKKEAIFLKELIAAGARFAGYGKKEKTFEATVVAINKKPHVHVEFKTRAVQEKFSKMEKDVHKDEKKNRDKSGTEVLSETDEIIACIVDTIDDLEELEQLKMRKES